MSAERAPESTPARSTAAGRYPDRPDEADSPNRRPARWRLFSAQCRLVWHLLYGLVLVGSVFRKASPARRQTLVRDWSQRLLALCGITLQVHQHGDVLDTGAMVVSNHVSWLDIYVIDAWRPTPFVAKSEIAGWPIVGRLAKAIGTVFIRRERRGDAKRIVDSLSSVLQNDGLICLFPEGTTTDGRSVLPFHANILQAAVSANAPVQPICMLYQEVGSGRQSLAPAYVGDLGLGDILRRVIAHGPIVAHLYVGEPVRGLTDRRRAAVLAHDAVSDALEALQAQVLPASEAEIAWVRSRWDAAPDVVPGASMQRGASRAVPVGDAEAPDQRADGAAGTSTFAAASKPDAQDT